MMENGRRKKSWTELKQVVFELRRQLSSLSTIVPSSVETRDLKDGRIRIFFLSTPANGWETTLLYTDVVLDDEPKNGRLQWHPVIESNFQSVSLASRSSREEQLILERKRLATWGITSYELHHDSGKLVFPAASTLFQCIDKGCTNGALFPAELRLTSSGPKILPQICPSNPDLVAYVCNADIWVTHTLSGSTQRMTYAHKGGRTVADDPLAAGIPSYVMQEEFNRYQGYWWQPASPDGLYRILYEETDESDVKIYSFPSSNSNTSGEIEQYRFPRAGTPNSKSNLKLLVFRLSDGFQIAEVSSLELRFPLAHMFPWMEYVVRAGWAPDLCNVWVQLLDRRQQRLELVLLPVSTFVEAPPNMYCHAHTPDHSHPALPPTALVLSIQTTDIWINVHDLLHMLPVSPCGKLTYIWASEETGFRHLYLITTNIGTGDAPHYNNSSSSNGEGAPVVQNRLGSALALTSGDWEVLGNRLWVDEARQLAYFIGLRETPLEKHLYVVSLLRPCEVKLLTRPGYSHSIDMNKECTMCVVVYSNIQKLPVCQVFRITHSDWTADGVDLAPIGFILEPSVPETEIKFPELYTHQIHSGDTIYAMVFRPHNFVPGTKYPILLNVYGGPEVQVVSNTFKGMRHLRMHMLAAQGYCVVAVDSRGSHHRGLKFEGHLKGRMGTVELDDQLEVLEWLSRRLAFLDMERVAIHGWSYGGYISLMALATRPHKFKVAIAGAPVTSWNLYDTGYTERYMDLPHNNLQGYKAGSVLNYVNQFPDDENRLLIIHGLIDENVHFHHTSQLISAMVRAGKPYQLQVYPNERHSLRNLDASKHYETTLLSFLQNHL